MKNQKISTSTREKIVSEFLTGKTQREVAISAEVSQSLVSKVLNTEGIDVKSVRSLNRSNETRLCVKCGEIKPREKFYSNKRSADGIARKCKDCSYAQNKAYTQSSPASNRKSSMRYVVPRKYGISYDEYLEKKASEMSCAICGAPSEHLDHDHVTGKLRKFLCQPCNIGIGCFSDSPERLRTAADYLERKGS